MVRGLSKIIWLLCCLMIYQSKILAQKVSEVSVIQLGNEILISYFLDSQSEATVELFLSLDNGSTWIGPLENCTGDIGKIVNSGKKQINWNVLRSMDQLESNEIVFKVKAKCKLDFEPEMIFVDGGTFQMGSKKGEVDERPIHKVVLSSFSIGKFEITQSQWEAVMGSNPSYFSDCPNCPVENVSWNDVQTYIFKLNRITGKNYRLPTESEWEFAARGGIRSKGNTFSGADDLEICSWNGENSGGSPHEVGKKIPNELDIFDMTGNVSEWCSDWDGNYLDIEQINPQGPEKGKNRVIRGGSWSDVSADCRVSYRFWIDPGLKNIDRGFRLVLD